MSGGSPRVKLRRVRSKVRGLDAGKKSAASAPVDAELFGYGFAVNHGPIKAGTPSEKKMPRPIITKAPIVHTNHIKGADRRFTVSSMT
jgi:hypothetical protein